MTNSKSTSAQLMTNWRWWMCLLLFVATTVNYMDRQVLSLTWKDFIAPEFHWTDADYGTITAVFSIFYAVCMLFAGRFVDWMGTKKGYLWAIGVWSAGACVHAACGWATVHIEGYGSVAAMTAVESGSAAALAIASTSVWLFLAARCILALGEAGKFWSGGLDPQGNEGTSRDLDAIPMLDKFVEEHPDFSPFGAKACLSVTGYEGLLGYRTQTDGKVEWTDALEANRQAEREAVKPIIEELKRTGWTFGSHTWGHIRLGSGNMAKIKADTEKWFDEVGSLVGETPILFYPHGERPDGNDWTQTGEAFQYLQSQGFRVFCSVGVESFSFIKKDICAVICDRLHPDGKTLRWSRNRYLQFYDAKEIMDTSVRPDLGVGEDWKN